jgi:hypothetical protein
MPNSGLLQQIKKNCENQNLNAMQKLFLFLFILLAMSGIGYAQSPEAINYQAVARDGSGALLANQNLTVRLGIYAGPGAATLAYEEEHSVTTNQFGLFSLRIGEGTATSGVFGNIDWPADEHHLKVEVDDGNGYADMGTQMLVAVPYAYFANEAEFATESDKAIDMNLGELVDVNAPSPSAGQVLGWNGTAWVPGSDNAGPWTENSGDVYYTGGYVGIGTSSPSSGLTVQSTAGYGSAISLVNSGHTDWRMTSWTDGTFRLVKASGTTFSPMVVDHMDGDIHMGTDAGDMALNVHRNTGISYVRISDGTSGPTSGLRMGMSGSGNAYIINDATTKSMSLGTEGTTRLRIDNNGHVGINDLSPDMMLHVKQDQANRAIRLEHNSTTDYWDNGVGTTTKNYKFYYNNLFRADISSVDGAYTQSSDRRLKREITDMEPVLNKVMQLQPSTYHYVDNSQDAPRSTGFVAQDVEPLFPNLVRDMEDGYKGVVYDGFAVVSIKAIQELNEKVQQLQNEVNALKNQSAERSE